MKYVKNDFVKFLGALLLLASCATDKELQDNAQQFPVQLSFTMQGTTRAAQNLNEDYLPAGKKLNIRILRGTSFTDYRYTTTLKTLSTTETVDSIIPDAAVPTYPESGTIDILAIYPASVVTAGATYVSFTVAADQTTDAAYIDNDLMFGAVREQARTTEPVEMKLYHKLVKICVEVEPQHDELGDIQKVELLNVKRSVAVNLNTGSVMLAADGDQPDGTVAMADSGAALIPAQTVSGQFIRVTTTQGTAVCTLASGSSYQLEEAHAYHFKFELRDGKLRLKLVDDYGPDEDGGYYWELLWLNKTDDYNPDPGNPEGFTD